MIERRLVAGLDAAPLVVLDATRPPSEEALDAAVRAAASLCIHLARAGGCAILLPGERRAVEVGPISAPGRRCTSGSRWSSPRTLRPRRFTGAGAARSSGSAPRPGAERRWPRAALGRFALSSSAGAPARHEGGLHGGLHPASGSAAAAPAGGGGVSGAAARPRPGCARRRRGARLDARPARRSRAWRRSARATRLAAGRAQRARRRGGGGGRRRRGPAVALTAPGAAASRRRDARRRQASPMLVPAWPRQACR